MILYSIVYEPDEAVSVSVAKIKRRLHNLIGENYGSRKSRAHISLAGFKMDEKYFPRLVELLKNAAFQIRPFPVVCEGYGIFTNKLYTLYIVLSSDARSEILNSIVEIRNSLKFKGFNKLLAHLTYFSSVPHITIGRELKLEWVNLISTSFGEFYGHFECKNLAVKRFCPVEGQYVTVLEIPLNPAAPRFEQLSIF